MQIAAIYASAFLFTLCLNVLSPLLPEIARDYSLPSLAGLSRIGGWNSLLMFLPMGLFSLLYGIAGRIQIPFRLLGVLLAAAQTWIYFARSPLAFGAGYLCVGSILGLAIPGFYAAARGLVGPDQSFKTSININIMVGVGMAAGQYASALIGGISAESWRLVYASLAGAALCSLPFLVIIDRAHSSVSSFVRAGQVPRDAWFLLSQYLPGSVPWGGLTVFIFPYLEMECGISKAAAAFLVTILGVGMIAGSFAAGLLGDRLAARGRRFVILAIVAFFLLDVAAAIAVIVWSHSMPLPQVAFLYFLAGALLSVPGSYIKAMLFSNAAPQTIHAVFAFENFFESMGKGIGPFIVALLIDYLFELKTAMVLAVFFWIVCLVPLLFLLREPEK